MEEIIRNLGVKIESILMSLFIAAIFFTLRVYEPEMPPSKRKIIYLAMASLAAALLVPGLVVRWMKEDNAYMTGVYTSIVILSFELIVAIIRDKVVNKFKDRE